MNTVKILLILLCIFCAVSCAQSDKKTDIDSNQSKQAAQEAESEAPGQETLSSFSLSGYAKDGNRQWDLEGKSADIGTEKINLTDVRGKVYGKQTNMTVVADEGSLNRIDNNVHLEKNVLLTTDDGSTVNCDYLDWDAQNQRLTTESPVEIKRGLLQANGRGLIAQPLLNLVELNKDVTVKMSLQNQAQAQAANQASPGPSVSEAFSPTVITCDGPLDVDYENQHATFNHNVKVKDQRGEIFADKMDIYFSTQKADGKQIQGMEGMGIERMEACGSVEIHHGGNTTYSQKALYETKTGKITLTGQPKLVIYSTEGFGQLMGSK